MLGKAFDRNLGTRDFDWNFAKHIFKKKHRVDSISNPKRMLKLQSAVEPLRKVLSGGSDGILHVER
jgi:molecular chaperone DnaK (HSP70)